MGKAKLCCSLENLKINFVYFVFEIVKKLCKCLDVENGNGFGNNCGNVEASSDPYCKFFLIN